MAVVCPTCEARVEPQDCVAKWKLFYTERPKEFWKIWIEGLRAVTMLPEDMLPDWEFVDLQNLFKGGKTVRYAFSVPGVFIHGHDFFEQIFGGESRSIIDLSKTAARFTGDICDTGKFLGNIGAIDTSEYIRTVGAIKDGCIAWLCTWTLLDSFAFLADPGVGETEAEQRVIDLKMQSHSWGIIRSGASWLAGTIQVAAFIFGFVTASWVLLALAVANIVGAIWSFMAEADAHYLDMQTKIATTPPAGA